MSPLAFQEMTSEFGNNNRGCCHDDLCFDDLTIDAYFAYSYMLTTTTNTGKNLFDFDQRKVILLFTFVTNKGETLLFTLNHIFYDITPFPVLDIICLHESLNFSTCIYFSFLTCLFIVILYIVLEHCTMSFPHAHIPSNFSTSGLVLIISSILFHKFLNLDVSVFNSYIYISCVKRPNF